MYTEEYDKRPFPFRDFLLKFIIIVIFALFLIWLIPKFTSPKTKTTETTSSKVFQKNLATMKQASIDYYSKKANLPVDGNKEVITLRQMISKKMLSAFTDNKGKACNVDKSYSEIYSENGEYVLKVKLKCSDEEDYVLTKVGSYSYCSTEVCEKDLNKTDENAKEEAAYNSKENLVLFLDYKVNNQKQEDVTITSTDGYIRRIDNVKTIGLVLTDIIEKKDKEENIENTIQGYNNEISDIYKFLYESLVNLTSVRSKETGAHLKRTQEYMKVMLEEFEKSFNTGEFEQQKTIEDIGVAATLHDIGKVGIPDEILNKPGKLTDEEYEKMKQHTVIGHQILENTYSDKISNDILEYAKEITLHHHEKYDGTGYPDGLKGDKIDIISRIMAVIDVYDALVNDRVYKKAMPYSEVEDYIISQSGKAFDPKIVNIFINSKEKLKAINEQYKE